MPSHTARETSSFGAVLQLNSCRLGKNFTRCDDVVIQHVELEKQGSRHLATHNFTLSLRCLP